jgi:hypothetical protein
MVKVKRGIKDTENITNRTLFLGFSSLNEKKGISITYKVIAITKPHNRALYKPQN